MAEPLLPASDVPVGGGVILAGRGVVVTRPAEDEFRAFGTLCPHRECVVKAVAAGMINCFCHGSRFRITDGSVAGGPSPSPLPAREVAVVDGVVTLVG